MDQLAEKKTLYGPLKRDQYGDSVAYGSPK